MKVHNKVGLAVAAGAMLSFNIASADAVKIPTHNWSSQLVGAEM